MKLQQLPLWTIGLVLAGAAPLRAAEEIPAFADLLVPKGSVAIDGVSLTVVGVAPAGFDVALIPHTLAVTTLGRLSVGAPLNLEADVLGKYVKRYLERMLPDAARSGR